MDYNGFVQIVLIFQRKLSKRRFPITFVNSVTNFIFVFRFSSSRVGDHVRLNKHRKLMEPFITLF